MNPEHYPIGLDYGLKPSERLKEQRRLSRKYQPAMNEMRQALAEYIDTGLLEALKESEKKWKPVLPAWEWSGLSLARAVKYCEKKGCKA